MIALTFDTDYVTADGLRRFVEEFPIPGRGTFFLWKPMPNLDLGEHELGLHPYLNDQSPWGSQVEQMLTQQGGRPVSLRAHSCAYSHMLGIKLAQLGFSVVSQATYLFKPGLEPYRHPWGLWELPIYYMDSMDFTMPHNWPELGHRPFDSQIIDRALHDPGLYVFDFHPLHVMMNTSSYPQYQRVREEVVRGSRSPFDVGFGGRGCRAFYLELVQRMAHAGVKSVACQEAYSCPN